MDIQSKSLLMKSINSLARRYNEFGGLDVEEVMSIYDCILKYGSDNELLTQFNKLAQEIAMEYNRKKSIECQLVREYFIRPES